MVRPTAGGSVAFTHCEVLDLNTDRSDSGFLPSTEMPWIDIDDFSTSILRVHNLSKPLIMGVINVTQTAFQMAIMPQSDLLLMSLI